MPGQAEIVEIALRGGAAGVCLVLAGRLVLGASAHIQHWLGALFVWGTAIYILLSGPRDFTILGPLADDLKIFAIYNAVFFWWFALSLFDDAFEWTWGKMAPAAVILALHPPWPAWEALGAKGVEQALHSSVSVVLMGHVVWIALRDRSDDLVDPRRRFRVVMAVVIGAAGAAIGVGEMLDLYFALPEATGLVHAGALAGLTFYFATWLLSPNRALFAPQSVPSLAPQEQRAEARPVPAADMPAFEKLMGLMDAGVYREEGLTVARLGEKVGVPEHQLRRLINRELGFRNFSTFLNARRIEDAKGMLADPQNARLQVLQIALDLGFGSIAPFNRAFKQTTGKTPSEFRKAALEKA